MPQPKEEQSVNASSTLGGTTCRSLAPSQWKSDLNLPSIDSLPASVQQVRAFFETRYDNRRGTSTALSNISFAPVGGSLENAEMRIEWYDSKNRLLNLSETVFSSLLEQGELMEIKIDSKKLRELHDNGASLARVRVSGKAASGRTESFTKQAALIGPERMF